MTKYLIIAIYDSACGFDVVSYDKVWPQEEKCELIRHAYTGYEEYTIPDDVYERYDIIVVVEDSTITVVKAVSKDESNQREIAKDWLGGQIKAYERAVLEYDKEINERIELIEKLKKNKSECEEKLNALKKVSEM